MSELIPDLRGGKNSEERIYFFCRLEGWKRLCIQSSTCW